MKSVTVFIAAWLWVILGCEIKPDLVVEREILLKTDQAFAALSLCAGAAEAFKEYLDSTAVQFSAGSGPISGRDNIYNRMKSGDDRYTLSWEPQFADVADGAEMGWTWGTYLYRSKIDSAETRGNYLNVWKKNADGNWRVVADIGNVKGE